MVISPSSRGTIATAAKPVSPEETPYVQKDWNPQSDALCMQIAVKEASVLSWSQDSIGISVTSLNVASSWCQISCQLHWHFWKPRIIISLEFTLLKSHPARVHINYGAKMAMMQKIMVLEETVNILVSPQDVKVTQNGRISL